MVMITWWLFIGWEGREAFGTVVVTGSCANIAADEKTQFLDWTRTLKAKLWERDGADEVTGEIENSRICRCHVVKGEPWSWRWWWMMFKMVRVNIESESDAGETGCPSQLSPGRLYGGPQLGRKCICFFIIFKGTLYLEPPIDTQPNPISSIPL